MTTFTLNISQLPTLPSFSRGWKKLSQVMKHYQTDRLLARLENHQRRDLGLKGIDCKTTPLPTQLW